MLKMFDFHFYGQLEKYLLEGASMKGLLIKSIMVAMIPVTVLGLATSLLTASTAAVSAAVDSWSRMDLPTTLNYQMLPDSEIWDLTGADDGTLFALVEGRVADDNR